MNCTQTRDWLAQQALEPAESPAEATEHLAGCAACRAAQEGLASLTHWGPQEPPLGLAEKTMRNIQEQPAQEFWIDRWIASLSAWLQSRSPLSAAAMACALFVLVLAPNVIRGRAAQGAMTGCQTNLRTLSVALEDYAHSHGGQYPADLKDFKVPLCPSVDAPIYALTVSPDRRAYTVYCAGQHHGQENFPQYSSAAGPRAQDSP